MKNLSNKRNPKCQSYLMTKLGTEIFKMYDKIDSISLKYLDGKIRVVIHHDNPRFDIDCNCYVSNCQELLPEESFIINGTWDPKYAEYCIITKYEHEYLTKGTVDGIRIDSNAFVK